jgi:hypothetical protein
MVRNGNNVSICIWYEMAMVRNGGYQTTRTETSRPVSEDKSARKRGLIGPYVKTCLNVVPLPSILMKIPMLVCVL